MHLGDLVVPRSLVEVQKQIWIASDEEKMKSRDYSSLCNLK